MRREYIDSMAHLHATWLSHLLQRLHRQQQHWLDALPSQCAVCRRWPGPRICSDCQTRWARPRHRCQGCALPLPALVSLCGNCLKKPSRLKRCTAVLDYGYPWQDLIASYKFRADLGLVRGLSKLMIQHPEVREQLRFCEALLPMPSSAQRVRERGFDHILLLAQSVSDQYGTPLLNNALQREHLKLPQHASSREQRLHQLCGMFHLASEQKVGIEGRHLLLLDDVMTTGATLDAAADCLLSAGAASVSAVVLARTA